MGRAGTHGCQHGPCSIMEHNVEYICYIISITIQGASPLTAAHHIRGLRTAVGSHIRGMEKAAPPFNGWCGFCCLRQQNPHQPKNLLRTAAGSEDSRRMET